MNIDKELAGASASLIILRIIAGKANYGYEIVKRANELSGDFFKWQEGTIYPLLRKLEKEGLVKSEWEDAENNRRRKYYHITQKGAEALQAGTEKWKGFYGVMLRISEVSNEI